MGILQEIKDRTTPIHPYSKQHMPVVANHNVVGPSGVLNAAQAKVQEEVGGHYDYRVVEQVIPSELPYAYVLVDQTTQRLQAQLDYRQKLSGIRLVPVTNMPDQESHLLHVPYISQEPLTRNPNGTHIEQYGLPYQATRKLKNKAEFHRWVVEQELGAHVPEFVVENWQNITASGLVMRDKIEQMYQNAQIKDYPVGLMIRSAEGDGQYGSGFIIELKEEKTVGNVTYYPGEIIFCPDGNWSEAKRFEPNDWEGVLQAAQSFVGTSMDTQKEPRVVMSRLLDVDSPGISAVITNGYFRPLNWNGQYFQDESTACKGTGNYSLLGNPDLQATFEQDSQNLFRHLWSHVVNAFPEAASSSAMINLDVMIMGPKEIRLWNAIINNDYLKDKYTKPSSVGYVGGNSINYQPRVCNPSVVHIAEVNPRLTNWTLTLIAHLQAISATPTIHSLAKAAQGNGTKILARDSWNMPEHLGPDDLPRIRQKLLKLHSELAVFGGGIILRMPTFPDAGIIVWQSQDTLTRDEYGDVFNILDIANQRLSSISNQ